MGWKNQLQLKEEYKDSRFQKNFTDLYALKVFFENSIVTTEYKPPVEFESIISLTSKGKEWVQYIKETVKDISLAEINLALFIKFYHQDLLIDISLTKPESIRKILDAEILGERRIYPWVYDRLLYDRFFDMFPIHTRELSFEETAKLIENTPQGVFQIRDFVIGPFGVLTSACRRFLPPVLSAPLWHCSDPACEALHTVKLSRGKNKVFEAITFIENEIRKLDGPDSEWDLFFYNCARLPDYYDDMHPGTLPWILVNAFSEAEIRNIFKTLVDKFSREMREKFPKSNRFKSFWSGSSEKISERLSKAQCFQLILLMSDESIAEYVDSLVENRTINVPVTEIRTPVVTFEHGGWLNVSYQCSRFGLRAVSGAIDVALAKLKRLIKKLYEKEEDLTELKWKFRHIEGESIQQKLDKFVQTEEPKCIIRDLIFNSIDHLLKTFKILRYGKFDLPQSPEAEEHLVEKILWKLGFDIGLYPPYQRLFWERLEKFRETAKTCDIYNEHDKERIRSDGVNFFVSLEEILEYSLSFATWTLLADHYNDTKFKCNFDETRRYMALRLNGLRLGSNEPLEFDAGGKNTLYPLIQGFHVLAELCCSTIKREEELKRPENELPGYYGKSEIEHFPFLHKALILDLRKEECDQIIQLLKKITSVLEGSQAFNVRNRIDHKGSNFPNKDEIEKVCSSIKDIVAEMESAGISPLLYLYSGRVVDQYRRAIVKMRDYKGREINLGSPSQFNLCHLPSVQQPLVIVPWIHVGDSFELIRFKFEENSDYVMMWHGYPKRKLRIPPKELSEESFPEQKQS